MKRITNVRFGAAVLIVQLFLLMVGSGWAMPELNAGRNAIVPEQKASPRVSMETEVAFSSASETEGADVYTIIKGEESTYASNELIIKFRDEFSVGEVASDLIDAGQPFETITDHPNLDKLNKRFKVKQMQRLMKSILPRRNKQGKGLSKSLAMNLHANAVKDFWKRTEKISARLGRGHQNVKDKKLPYLGNIYKVIIDAGSDVEEVAAAYRQDPHIEYAQPNYLATTYYTPNDYYFSTSGSWGQPFDDLWGLKLILADQGWDISMGSGIVVAVVDTGLDSTHPDIAANVWMNDAEIPGNQVDDDGNGFIDDVNGWDFYNSDNDPFDGHGHGTHVSGTIAAVADNGIGIAGVAPQAEIMAVKGLSDGGSGTFDVLADSIIYAAANGADIINNSWGCSGPCPGNPVVEDAVRFAHGLGSVVVFAAGNSSMDVYNFSPQNMAETITVGATTELDELTYFTNYGMLLDITAPGGSSQTGPPGYEPARSILSLKSSVTSSAMDGSGQLVVGTDYLRQAGTSMAAPHVSGLAALLMEVNPDFTPEEIRQVLRKGSDDIYDAGFDRFTGYGRMNVYQSLNEPPPLEAIITDPAPATISGLDQVDIRGSAAGVDFAQWILEYAEDRDPDTWIEISTSTVPVSNSILATWDLSTVHEGKTTLHLRVENTNGEEYEDLQAVNIDNIYITEPSPDDTRFFRSGDSIAIEGTVQPAFFSHYTIDIYTDSGTRLSDAAVTLANNGLLPVADGLLATWDTTGVPADRYRIWLRTYLTDSTMYIEETYVIVDPTLHPGWPVNIGGYYTGGLKYVLLDHLITEDINGDGAEDLIISYGKNVRIFDHTGALLPGWPQSIDTIGPETLIQRTAAVADLNGDGSPEVIAASNSSNIYVWEADGTLLPGWPVTMGGHIVAIDDLDGDGEKEIIAVNIIGSVRVFDVNGNLKPGWPFAIGGFAMNPQVADVDGDGTREIAITGGSNPASLYLLRFDGSVMPGWPQQLSSYSYYSYPALGDLDGDGDWELVIGDRNGYVHVYNYDGTTASGWPQYTNGLQLNSPTLGDIDGDGLPEIVVGTDTDTSTYPATNYLYVFNGDGTLVPGWPVIEDYYSYSSFGFGPAAIVDVDGDSQLDVIASMDHRTRALRAYDKDGNAVAGFPKATDSTGASSTNTAAVADLDGDGYLELAWLDSDHNLFIWDLPSPVSSPCAWSMFNHDPRLTGKAGQHQPVLDPIGNKTVDEETLLEFTVSAFDPDMDTLSYSALNLPPGAVFDSAARTFSWTPSVGQTGTYINIRFTVDDGIFSDFEEITIAVGDNQPPTAIDDNYSVDEDDGIIVAAPGVLANDSDPENGPIHAALISGTASGVLNFNSNGSFDYTPNSGFFGSDSFTYVANDGQLDSAVATVSITVNAVNDAPTADDQSLATDEDTALAVTLTGSDVEGDPLSFAVASQPANGTLSGTPPALTYTPDANFFGADSFTYTANDGQLDSAIATVSITVNAINDAPTADDQTLTTNEDTALAVTLTGSDVEGDPLNFTVASQPANGTLSGIPPALTYTPNANFFGSDSFTYTANDGQMDSPVATVSITVNAIPDLRIESITMGTVKSGSYTNAIAEVLVLDESSAAVAGALVNGHWEGLTGDTESAPTDAAGIVILESDALRRPDGTFTFVVDSVAKSGYTFDSANSILSNSIDYPPATQNNPPVAVDDNAGTTKNSAVTVDVLANDSDPDGDPLSVDSVTQPADGSAVVNVDGTIMYTPDIDFIGTDSFTYTISDGSGGSDAATVTITVTDLPVGGFMHIDSIAMGYVKIYGKTSATAGVAVVDSQGVPVTGVAVYGEWTGAAPDTGSGTTDAAGMVTLNSPGIKNASGKTFTFTVTGLVKTGWTYDDAANVETTDSITVP